MSIKQKMKLLSPGFKDEDLTAHMALSNRCPQSLDKTSYFCLIYKCDRLATDGKGYCGEHTSPLRSGIKPFLLGCAPVIRKRNV